jgi:5'-3' exonuclease
MILIDLTQVLIASLMAQTRGGKEPINEDMVRHICLKSLAMYRKKYQRTYGELVLADDSYNVWRKDVYPFYKANRKKTRDKDSKDWNQIFDCISIIREELKVNFPYKYICISKCEADDIIGTLCEKYGDTENIMIVSGDKDFQQLQRYKKVKQFSPITKKNIKLTQEQAEEYLRDHIISGDTGDGVPNVLSQDDVFVSGMRQRPLSKKKREVIKDPLVANDDEVDRNLQRNRSLIDLTYIPNEYKNQILHEFDNVEVASRGGLLNYFIKNRLMDLEESIGDF